MRQDLSDVSKLVIFWCDEGVAVVNLLCTAKWINTSISQTDLRHAKVKRVLTIHGKSEWARGRIPWHDVELVHLFIKYGADVRSRKNSALRRAAENGNIDVVKCLLDHGADVHSNGNDALRHAVYYNHIDVVRFLLENGARVDDNVLFLAKLNDHLEIFEYLWEHCDDKWRRILLRIFGSDVSPRNGRNMS